MAKLNKQSDLIKFLSLWLAATVTLLVLDMVLGVSVVLGNANLTAPLAAAISGIVIAVIVYIVPTAVKTVGMEKVLVKNENAWYGVFLLANILGVWALKRLADVTGLGISSIVYVLLVAVVLTLEVWAVSRFLGPIGRK
ncbi:MAG: hypothetical protein NUV69_02240 [Candidatus Curtissbacteria bacterium]|nr:hypothetical protein [Candidatus Curtissbacteria bacterium]